MSTLWYRTSLGRQLGWVTPTVSDQTTFLLLVRLRCFGTYMFTGVNRARSTAAAVSLPFSHLRCQTTAATASCKVIEIVVFVFSLEKGSAVDALVALWLLMRWDGGGSSIAVSRLFGRTTSVRVISAHLQKSVNSESNEGPVDECNATVDRSAI